MESLKRAIPANLCTINVIKFDYSTCQAPPSPVKYFGVGLVIGFSLCYFFEFAVVLFSDFHVLNIATSVLF